MTDTTDKALDQPSIKPDFEGFARAILEAWPTGDIEGAVLFDVALQYGMIREVPGGYDPENHIDAECIYPEPGDPWYEYTFGGKDGPGLFSLAEMRSELDALRAQLATARADALREVEDMHEREWSRLAEAGQLDDAVTHRRLAMHMRALIDTPTPSAPSPEAVARAALVDMIAQLPDGDVRIEVELVHGGWCGYVLVSPDNGPISPASPERIYARTKAMPTRSEAVAAIPATLAAIVAKAGGGE